MPLRSGIGRELLLYEIGVHHAYQRRGLGRALLSQMESWMHENRITEVWVGADNAVAVSFYRACGFTASLSDDFTPVYMTRELNATESAR